MKMVVEHLLKQDWIDYDVLIQPKVVDGRRFIPEQEAERAGHEEIAEMLRDAREAEERKKESEIRKAVKKFDLGFILNE